MGVKTESGLKILALWLLAYPLVSALVSGIVAGPIAATEDVTFGTAFLFSFMGMTLCGIPLTPWPGPTGTLGIIIAILIGVLQVTWTAICIGITAGPMIDPFVDPLGLSNIKMLPFYMLIVYPLSAVVLSMISGGILAAAEGWPFMDGFVMALGEATATGVVIGNPLPETTTGTIVGIFVAIKSMAFLGVVIAVGSVPLLGFGLTFNESPLWAKVPFCLNAEQRKECLGAGSAASGKKIQVHAAETEGTPAPAPDA
jgi:hypothetical protein